MDYIIDNTDRHFNNFGFIRDANALSWLSVQPIYDSGTSMWCREVSAAIYGKSANSKKAFRSRHTSQIELVEDFSWLVVDLLEGIEDEYKKILSQAVWEPSKFEMRNRKLCAALRQRIELLKNTKAYKKRLKNSIHPFRSQRTARKYKRQQHDYYTTD
ncbi:MAG: hypothetical protein LBU04_00840 [Christensenellaceae bacterium]|nr:hypothetical protein [Christensenellaceae bacterium]